MVQLSHSYMTSGKTIDSFDYTGLCYQNDVSAFSNTLSRFVIALMGFNIKQQQQQQQNPRSWHPVTSWQIDGETVETVTEFIFLGSKITSDGGWSHSIKRCLLLGRKAMTNLDSILKSKAITLPTKVCIVKAVVFPVVMYGCETWTIKKAESQRNQCLQTMGLEKTLRISRTARR